MKQPPKNKLLWTGLAAFAVACGGGALSQRLDGDPTSVAVGLRAQTAQPSVNQQLIAALDAGSGLNISAGKACVNEIRIKLPDTITCEAAGIVETANVRCEDEIEEEDGVTKTEYEVIIQGAYLFDLIAGTSTPSLAELTIPSGNYRELEFRLGEGCGLDPNVTLVLNGTVTDTSNVVQEIEIQINSNEDLEIEAPGDLQVLEGSQNELFASLILSQLFNGVDFVQCVEDGGLVPNGSGVLIINENTMTHPACEDVFEQIEDGVEEFFEYEDNDSDDDGLDDDDDSDDDNDGVEDENEDEED